MNKDSYFFFKFHSERYDIHVLKGEDRTKQISYATQYQAYKRAITSVGISTSKVTHVNRTSAINMIDDEQVPDNQLRRIGRWGSDRMTGCYLTSIPKQGIRAAAGFPRA